MTSACVSSCGSTASACAGYSLLVVTRAALILCVSRGLLPLLQWWHLHGHFEEGVVTHAHPIQDISFDLLAVN